LFVDRESTRELAARFTNDRNVDLDSLVAVDVVADAVELPFRTGSLDFLIANHVIEHLPNPIGALREWHRCLGENGRLYLTVPDKRFCFDAQRALTTWDHLCNDLQAEETWSTDSSRDHLREWLRVVAGVPSDEVEAEVDRLLEGHDYHYHTWTYESLLATLDQCAQKLGLRFEREADLNSYETWGEMILVLKKNPEANGLMPARYRYPEWHVAQMDRFLGELLPGTVWRQSFSCAGDGLSSIHVRFATYGRRNSGPLWFRLYEESSRVPLVSLSLDMSALNDNIFQIFEFAPIQNSARKRFSFTLESPEASGYNAVTAWGADSDDDSACLTANDAPVPNTILNFKAFSSATLSQKDAWSGDTATPAVRTADRLRRAGRQLLSALRRGGG
jgi:hypothetical protein